MQIKSQRTEVKTLHSPFALVVTVANWMAKLLFSTSNHFAIHILLGEDVD